ncbi:MAG: hypothetical protein K8S23_12250 [Candidatus Cloacimonetes bacterium]|nr:hypothetical protein [Candidatus Cloacimonadota bacterium]
MKNFLALSLLLIILLGCSQDGDLKVINQTNYNLYLNIEHNDYIVNGDNILFINFEMGKKFLVWSDSSRKYGLYLEGETFVMQETIDDNLTDVYYTEVEIEAGKTKKVFVKPTHTSFKIKNNTENNISNLTYITTKLGSTNDQNQVLMAENVDSNSTLFKQIPYTDLQNPIFRIEFQFYYEGDLYIYDVTQDNELIILGKDEQFLVEFGE